MKARNSAGDRAEIALVEDNTSLVGRALTGEEREEEGHRLPLMTKSNAMMAH